MFLKISQFYFQWVQLIDSIPEKWKFIIKKNNEVTANLITHQGRIQEFGKRGRSGLVTKEARPWLGATCQKISKIRPPRLAKNALAQCYIKLSFIAEIH